jgi:hypothetical protein
MLNIFGIQLLAKGHNVDFYLHQYKSYEEYKNIQIFHNKRKISKVWADEQTMDRVFKIVMEQSTTSKILGLCHGVRNGFEQNYLNSLDDKMRVIGTDISDTATNYPNSVEWDFHNTNPEWIHKFDFVYTNSLDQSWKPKDALEVWLDQLNTRGVLIIEHTESHGPAEAGEMDPFGVRPSVLPYVLTMWFGHKISISHSVAKKKNCDLDAWLFVVKKNDPSYFFCKK